MKAGWRPPPFCATRASSSTTRGTTGTRSTSSPARRFTATRRCSGRWFRPLRATWARAVPSPATARCATFPAEEHKNVQRAVVLLRLAVALNQDRASDVLRVAAKVYPKRVYLELRAGAHGRGAGAVVAAQGGGLLPRGLWARAFCHAGIDGAGHARIDEPLQQGRMLGPCRCGPPSPCACARRRRRCR